MKTKLYQLLKFPCSFTYKVIGSAKLKLTDQIIKIVQQHLPDNYQPFVRLSKKGNFCSVSITVIATNIKQIEKLYEDLSKIKSVRIVL
ncbi:MAG: DUF493 family protein YbeD [Arsenophonus sp. ER-QC15-MAG3]